MGDRGNIKIVMGTAKDPEPAIYLYTHWEGGELPHTLQAALAKHWRWSDASYLVRIIFDTMTDGLCEETGFGISTYIPDNEHPILVVNPDTEKVTVEQEDGTAYAGPYPIGGWTFEDYLSLDIAETFDDWF